MASFVQFAMRHYLTKALLVKSSHVDIISFPKQHVRHLPRWAHRRPIRVIYAEDAKNDKVNYADKLKIERECIQSVTNDQENRFENEDLVFKNNETISSSSNSMSVNTSMSTSGTDVNYDKKHTMPKSKFHSVRDHESDTAKVHEAETTQKSSMQSKKARKLQAKEERKASRIKESAAKAGLPVYTKLPDNDPKLSSVMLIAKSRKQRKKRSVIVLEGKRLIKDAMEAGYVPHMVFFSRVKDAADLNLPDSGVELYKISYKSISLWSDLTTSPGILGVFKTPTLNDKKPGKDALPLTIICDSIRDPGNLGSILRGAAGVGCEKVILMKGCVDLWEPKVLRSGAGAQFRTAVVSDVEWDELETHVDDEASVFLADNSAYVLQDIQEDEDNDVDSSDEDEENMIKCSPEVSEPLEVYKNRLSSIPVVPYFGVDYVNQTSIILVIGGETEGLSINAFKLACDRYGVRLNVPLSNNIESLNSGTALGIIAFEIKRQFLTKLQHKSVEDINAKMEKIHVPNV